MNVIDKINSKSILLLFVLLTVTNYMYGKSAVKSNPPIKKTATLWVVRVKRTIVGRFANVDVYINEEKVGEIGNGEEKKFEFVVPHSKHVTIRFEAPGISVVKAIREAASQDEKVVDNFRPEIRVKVKRGEILKYSCDYNMSEIFVRKIEI